MAVKFFGQFLVEKKVISRMDLLRAIELQEKTNLRFGDMVIEMGLMTNQQADRIHRAQRREDIQFGDMAVKMGLLSSDQVQHVLNKQRSEHLYIGEALVRLNSLTKQQLDCYLNEFDLEQKAYISEKIVIPAGVPHQPIWEIVADLTYKMLTRVAGLAFRAGPCTVTETLPARPLVVEMGFSGSVSARYLLTVSENARKLVANAILKDEATDNRSAEKMDDSVKEFVNIVCGNVASKATTLGYSIDISPAQVRIQTEADLAIPANQTGLMFPIYLTDGEMFELTIFVPKG